jgi:hypothetical protein
MRPSGGLLGVSTHICVVSYQTLLFVCYPCFVSCCPAYLLCLNGHRDRAGIINNKCTSLPALGYCVLFAQTHGCFALYTRKESLHKLNRMSKAKSAAERNRTRRTDGRGRSKEPGSHHVTLVDPPQKEGTSKELLFSFGSFTELTSDLPVLALVQFPMCGSILSGGE